MIINSRIYLYILYVVNMYGLLWIYFVRAPNPISNVKAILIQRHLSAMKA